MVGCHACLNDGKTEVMVFRPSRCAPLIADLGTLSLYLKGCVTNLEINFNSEFIFEKQISGVH